MRHRSILVLGLLIAPIFVSVAADEGSISRCSDPPYRQFDFWVGTWDVTTPDGKVAGSNQIRRVSDNCALVERWTGSRGSHGTSLNFYEKTTKQWHQIWIDGEGGVLRLSGGLQEGKMVLSGTSSTDRNARHRITWAPLGNGEVRQLWESSGDGGQTWKTEFDGTYTRRFSAGSMM